MTGKTLTVATLQVTVPTDRANELAAGFAREAAACGATISTTGSQIIVEGLSGLKLKLSASQVSKLMRIFHRLSISQPSDFAGWSAAALSTIGGISLFSIRALREALYRQKPRVALAGEAPDLFPQLVDSLHLGQYHFQALLGLRITQVQQLINRLDDDVVKSALSGAYIMRVLSEHRDAHHDVCPELRYPAEIGG